jgi:uncharacterized protein (TIGR02996 family)
MSDFPASLHPIATDPDDREHWHALADWLRSHGRDDEATTVRVLRPTLRDNLACVSLATTLDDVARNAGVLAAVARNWMGRPTRRRLSEAVDQLPMRPPFDVAFWYIRQSPLSVVRFPQARTQVDRMTSRK